jgi:mRNA interferase RelE/StbE
MPYYILIKKQARKTLQSLSRPDRNRITEKIMLLSQNPNDSALDVKSLQGEPLYRLRVGQWRIIFDKDDDLKIIAIERIKPRGDAYK